MSVQDTIAAAAEKALREQQEAKAKLMRDVLLDTQTKVFDRAAAYINLIMFGGYAGAFAIWNFTREHLPAQAEIWIGLLLTLSLATFIMFEVFKMWLGSRMFLKQRVLIVRKLTPDQFFDEFGKLERDENTKVVRWLLPVWYIALAVSVLSALGAVAMLLWNFVSILLLGVPDSVASLHLIEI